MAALSVLLDFSSHVIVIINTSMQSGSYFILETWQSVPEISQGANNSDLSNAGHIGLPHVLMGTEFK